MAQQVQVVDQVGQQHAGPGLAAPGNVEIVLGLLQLPECGDVGQAPQGAAAQQFMGAGDQWVVPSMMPHQHRDPSGPRGRYQFAHFIQMHAHRFFQQHRHACGEAIQGGADMEVVRVGNDHRIRADFPEQGLVIGKVRHLPLCGDSRRLGAGICHRAEAGLGQSLEVLIVLLPHIADADQGDAQWRAQWKILL